MSNDLNRCDFIGRLGQDPELKYSAAGNPICNFSIAVGSQWKSKDTGEKKESVEWVRIVVFGPLAEICAKYLDKGKQVYVSGRLQNRSWDDPNTGEKKYTTEVVVDQRGVMQMLGSREGSGQPSRPPAPARPQPQRDFRPDPARQPDPYREDDLPF